MKKFRILLPLILSMIIIINLSSCLLFVKEGKGNHYGWHNNWRNPHYPYRIDPVIFNGNNNGNGHGHENGNGHGNGHHR